jgi:hypothetical protein
MMRICWSKSAATATACAITPTSGRPYIPDSRNQRRIRRTEPGHVDKVCNLQPPPMSGFCPALTASYKFILNGLSQVFS